VIAMRVRSLRRQLLIGLLVPVLGFVAYSAVGAYRSALAAANTAYDRTLLASAKTIGEQLRMVGEGSSAHVSADLPYSALEAFEADMRSRMYYRILGAKGETVSGFDDLPAPQPAGDARSPYAALVHFYDAEFRGQPVRMAVLLQPVAGSSDVGMATIQVAETFELRRSMADELLAETLLRQALQIALIAGVVVWVVQRATRPVRELGATLAGRAAGDLSPLPTGDAPRELLPLLEATNSVMSRLSRLLEHQKRFVRDASHQLRTPLAVLKAQLQSAARGDVAPATALAEVQETVEQATVLANQLLALAKVEQIREQADAPVNDWAEAVRRVALDLSPLIVARQLDFDLDTQPAQVRAHEWALRELSRNLIHNAIQHGPVGGRLAIRLLADRHHAALTVSDSGPGLGPQARTRLFQAFAAAGASGGSGLGLAICHGIATTLGGQIHLDNREAHGVVRGLDATVRLPLAQPSPAVPLPAEGQSAR
jgi:two-component system, OmpR family, sensor histidine kinase TctE